jgi:hypothetical protein
LRTLEELEGKEFILRSAASSTVYCSSLNPPPTTTCFTDAGLTLNAALVVVIATPPNSPALSIPNCRGIGSSSTGTAIGTGTVSTDPGADTAFTSGVEIVDSTTVRSTSRSSTGKKSTASFTTSTGIEEISLISPDPISRKRPVPAVPLSNQLPNQPSTQGRRKPMHRVTAAAEDVIDLT